MLVAIWALTGPDLPWIVWPLLGIGFIAALDAWRVYASPPISEAELAGEEDRAAAVRRLVRRRRLRHHAGAQVILNIFIVGVWLAAGGELLLAGVGDARLRDRRRPEGAAAPRAAHRSLLGDHP